MFFLVIVDYCILIQIVELPKTHKGFIKFCKSSAIKELLARQNMSPALKQVMNYCMPALRRGRPLGGAMIVLMGESGVGKSTTINSLFDAQLCATSASQSCTSGVAEYYKECVVTDENPALSTYISFIDTPGFKDTNESVEEDNIKAIIKFFAEHPDLQKIRTNELWAKLIRRKVRYNVYPNLVMFMVKALDNRMISGEGTSDFAKCLQKAKSCHIIDRKKINAIVVVTHSGSIATKPNIFQEESAKYADTIRYVVRKELDIKDINIVFIENQPKRFFDADGEFYVLPNGELNFLNLFEVIKNKLQDNNDLIGQAVMAWFFSDKCTEKLKKMFVRSLSIDQSLNQNISEGDDEKDLKIFYHDPNLKEALGMLTIFCESDEENEEVKFKRTDSQENDLLEQMSAAAVKRRQYNVQDNALEECIEMKELLNAEDTSISEKQINLEVTMQLPCKKRELECETNQNETITNIAAIENTFIVKSTMENKLPCMAYDIEALYGDKHVATEKGMESHKKQERDVESESTTNVMQVEKERSERQQYKKQINVVKTITGMEKMFTKAQIKPLTTHLQTMEQANLDTGRTRQETAKVALDQLQEQKKECFHWQSSVITCNGPICLTQLRTGDIIESVQYRNSPNWHYPGGTRGQQLELNKTQFITHLHINPEKNTEFLAFETSINKPLIISSNHLTYVWSQISQGSTFMRAKEIKIGDLLYFVHEMSVRTVSITKVTSVVMKGYCAPLTTSGTLVVDGFVVSCYSNIDSHIIAHASMAPLRVYYRLKMVFSFIFYNQCSKEVNAKKNSSEQELETVATYSSGNIHGYAQVLMKIRKYLPLQILKE